MLKIIKNYNTVVFLSLIVVVFFFPAASQVSQEKETKLQEPQTEKAAPEEAKAEETQLEEVASEKTQSEETQPEEVVSKAAQPEEVMPEDSQSVETQKPEDVISEVAQPEEIMPEDSQSVKAQKPEDVKSEEAEPGLALPEDTHQEETAGMAILPIRNSGGIITPETKELLTWIHFKLFGMNVKDLLKHEEMVGILSHDTSINLDSCYSKECIFFAGSKLHVKNIVFGTMDTRDSVRRLSLSLGNTSTMKVINKVTIETKGTILDLMNQLSPLLSSLLAYGIDASQSVIPSSAPPAPKYATLELGSEPEGAEVFIDGDKVGKTPYRNDSLKEGTYDVVINLYAYKQFKKDIYLSKGDHKKLKIRLLERFGSLTVLSKPQGAAVVLNNDTTGQTPFSSDTIVPGNYNFGLYLQGYVSFTKAISVFRGQADTITATLVSKAFVDSVARAKKNKRRLIRRIAFGTLTAGFTGLGYYTNELVKGSLDNEDNAYMDYMAQKDAALQESKWKDYNEIADHTDKLIKERNAWYIIGGLFCVGFAISIPF